VNIIKDLFLTRKISIFDMKTIKKLFNKLRKKIIYFLATDEQKFYIRIKRNRLRIIDIMSIRLDKQKGLSIETVKKLNDLFKNYEPQTEIPVGAERIAEIMYYDANKELKLTEDTIKGLNEIFNDEEDGNSDVKANREKFFNYMIKKGQLC